MAKVLITGGAGFIGSNLAARLAAEGAQLRVLDSLRTGYAENLAGIPHEFILDSVENLWAVKRACEGVETVYHLAAMVSVPESMEKIALAESINTGGTLNVLAAAREAGVRKVVFASSSAVYGSIERPEHRESDLPSPASPYAITKLAGEHYLRLYAEHFGLPTVALRFFNVFGPRQDPNSAYAAAVAIFMDRARRGEPLTIYGDGEQTRDFIHVDDVVSALILAAERGTGVYNVSRGEKLTVNELAARIVALAGGASPILHAPPRAGDVRHSRGNADRLRALGWAPRVDLESGLAGLK